MRDRVQLSGYDNSWYSPGRNMAWRAAWLFAGLPLFRSTFLPFSGFRAQLLRLFGARVGKGVVIHSEVNVKYPWHLAIGEFCWIGERCWIDNLTSVTLENNVCLSQSVYVCTGNHDWTDPHFGLRIAPVRFCEGSWAGARSTVLPGAALGECAVVAAGSTVAGDVPAYQIFAGNPAVFVRTRKLREGASVQTRREATA